MTVASHAPASPPAPAGFTLVEIMVVIVILGLLAGLVVPSVVDRADEARLTTAEVDCQTIAGAARSYRATNGRWPDPLDILWTRDERGRRELEPVDKDPWGEAYVMQIDEVDDQFVVSSKGPDRQLGTPDDVSSVRRKQG